MAAPHGDEWASGDVEVMAENMKREMLAAGGRPSFEEDTDKGRVEPAFNPLELFYALGGKALLRALTQPQRRSVPAGMTRLFRGETTKPPRTNTPEWIARSPQYQASEKAAGRWWTHEPENADWYVKEAAPTSRMVWQDVPRQVAEQAHLPNQPADIQRYSLDPEREWFLPETYKGKGAVMDERAMLQRLVDYLFPGGR